MTDPARPLTLGAALRETVVHGMTYGVGHALMKVAEVALIPVYARLLPPADYGVLSICLIAASIFNAVFGLGIGSALFRSYYDYEEEDKRSVVITTAFMITAISSVALMTLGWVFASRLAVLLFGDEALASYVTLSCIIAGLELLEGLPLAVYRARKMSVAYSGISVVLLLLRLGLIVGLVVVARLGIWGVLIGLAVGHAIAVIVLFARMPSTLRFRVRWVEARKLLAYGAPLVLVSLATLVLSMSDRFFIQHFHGLAAVGVYTLGYQLGMAISVLIVGPFKLIWPAMMCSVERQPYAGTYYARTLTYFAYVGLMLVLAISIPAREIVTLVATAEYRQAAMVVPFVALSYLLLGTWSVANVGLALQRKTLHTSVAAMAAAIVNLILNIALIPRFGMLGAAFATLLSYLVMCAVNFAMSDFYYPVQYEWSRLARLATAAALIYVLGINVDTSNLWLSAFIKITCVACFPLALVPLRFYSGEPEYVWQAIRHWAARVTA